MASALLLLFAYSVTIVAGLSVVARGLLRRFGALSSAAAAVIASVVGLAMVVTPLAALGLMSLRPGGSCGADGECYDFVAVVLAVPLGWAAGLFVLAAGIVVGQRRARA